MLRLFSALALTALLGACATPASLKPGTSIAEARSALGRPTAEIALAGGGSRLQYSGQPFNQVVWNADFDPQGRLVGVEQMLTDDVFARVRSSKDTQSEVLRDFGPPAYVWQFKLKNETAWMYRYYTYGGFRAAMYIYFDPAGVVKRTETGLDPWTLGDGNRNE